jgi:Bacterial membrane protein YfhO
MGSRNLGGEAPATPKPRRLWTQDLGAIAVLLLATLGYFWRILFTPDAWKPAGGGDLVSFLFPTYRFAAASLSSGDLPLWNPHLYSGAPFLADMQTGLFYLPNLLLFLIFPDFSYKAMEWMAVLHIFLAGLFMYLCLRYFEPGRHLRVPAALVGALAYMFSDLFLVHFGNLNLIAVAAWLPLIFLLFWRALRSRSLGLAIGAGVVFGLSTLEGHLQITLYIGLALAVAAVVDAATAPRSRRGWAWSLLILVVTAAVAVGLAALVLLPAFEYSRLGPRAELPYQDAARYSLIPGLLGEMLVPALFSSREPSLYWGVWDRVAVGYLGIFPLILAGLAVLLRRGRRVGLFVVLAVAAFLLALGGQSVVHGWAYLLLPGFGQLRAPARAIFLMDFALAALAALALDRLLWHLDRRAQSAFRSAWRALLWLSGAALLLGGAWAYLVIYQAQDRDPTLFWRVSAAGSGVIFALLMLGASLAWLGARRWGRLRRTPLAWLAVSLVFFDLASVGAYTDLGTEPPTAGFDHPQIVEFLRSQPGFFRIDSRTDVWGVWQPDLALLAGLYDTSGIDNPLVIADMARYMEGTGGRSTRLYDLLGVEYVLGSKTVTLDWNKFSLAFDGDPTVNVYRNATPLPRAFMVHRAVVAAGHEDAWARLHEASFDPAGSAILEGGQPLELQAVVSDTVSIVRYQPDALEIDVEAAADGYLVLSDPYYPGWRAELDGVAATILRADYAFRAVAVPAGRHRVVMSFRPGSWSAGLIISGITVLVVLGLGVWSLVHRARRRRRSSGSL